MRKTKKERKKEKSIKLRNKKLIKEYPFLFPRNIFTGNSLDNYDYSFTEYPDNMGWMKCFGKMFLKELKEELVKSNCLKDYKIGQIKSKYGTLRWYDFGGTERTHDIISKYEFISGYCCEICGQPDVGTTKGYWIMPICKKCYDKNKYYIKPYEEFVDTEYSTIPNEYKVTVFNTEGNKVITYDISDTVDKIRNSWKKRHKKSE